MENRSREDFGKDHSETLVFGKQSIWPGDLAVPLVFLLTLSCDILLP